MKKKIVKRQRGGYITAYLDGKTLPIVMKYVGKTGQSMSHIIKISLRAHMKKNGVDITEVS